MPEIVSVRASLRALDYLIKVAVNSIAILLTSRFIKHL